MSFYRGRKDFGINLFIDSDNNDESEIDLVGGIGESIYRIAKFKNDQIEMELTAQAWRKKGDYDYGSAVYRAAIPGDIMREFFYKNFYDNILTDTLLDKISIRRDHELPFSKTTKTISGKQTFPMGLRLLDTIARWFDIYDFPWLRDMWYDPVLKSLGLSDKEKTYHIIFVHIVQRITAESPITLNHRSGDYDELIRCMRAIHALHSMDDNVKELYESKLIEPIRKRYEQLVDGDMKDYGLWEMMFYESHNVKLREYENRLLGIYDRTSDSTPLSIELIADIAHLFKFIDIRSGSYYRLERLFKDVEGSDFNNNIPTTVNSRIKRRTCEYTIKKEAFSYRDCWVDPCEDIYVIHDVIRRKLARELKDVEMNVLDCVSERIDTSFMENDGDSGIMDDIRSIINDNLLEKTFKKVLAQDKGLKDWLEGGEEAKDLSVVVLNVKDNSIDEVLFELNLNDDNDSDAAVFAIFVYDAIYNYGIPTKKIQDKLQRGVLSRDIKPEIKSMMNKHITKLYGLGHTTAKTTVGDYLLLALSDYMTGCEDKDDWNGFYSLNEAFLHSRMGIEQIAPIIKSIILFLTNSPSTSMYVYKQIFPDADTELMPYKGRNPFLTDLKDSIINVESKFYIDSILKPEIQRTGPYNIIETDDLYFYHILL